MPVSSNVQAMLEGPMGLYGCILSYACTVYMQIQGDMFIMFF